MSIAKFPDESSGPSESYDTEQDINHGNAPVRKIEYVIDGFSHDPGYVSNTLPIREIIYGIECYFWSEPETGLEEYVEESIANLKQHKLEKTSIHFDPTADSELRTRIDENVISKKGTVIGSLTIICEGSQIGDNSKLLGDTLIGKAVLIGSDVFIGKSCTIGAHTAIGDKVKIGIGNSIPENCTIENGVNIPNGLFLMGSLDVGTTIDKLLVDNHIRHRRYLDGKSSNRVNRSVPINRDSFNR